MIWGARWEEGFRIGNSCTPVVDSCQCMAKQINKIRNETDTTEIQRLIRDYYEELYTNKMENWEEMDKFLEM